MVSKRKSFRLVMSRSDARRVRILVPLLLIFIAIFPAAYLSRAVFNFLFLINFLLTLYFSFSLYRFNKKLALSGGRKKFSQISPPFSLRWFDLLLLADGLFGINIIFLLEIYLASFPSPHLAVFYSLPYLLLSLFISSLSVVNLRVVISFLEKKSIALLPVLITLFAFLAYFIYFFERTS